MEIKIVNTSKHQRNPEYATKCSAGMDLVADIEAPIELKPMGKVVIPTGVSIELPEGYEAQIRPRSGLSIKHGITLINTPGTIDADYRGEIKLALINLGDEFYTISPNERVAQMIVAKHEIVKWKNVESLTDSERGKGGFGHTGKH